MVRRFALAWVVGMTLFCVSNTAHAARRRIVLVRADATLHRAVVVALTAWDIEVHDADVSSPGAALPEAERRAAAIAAGAHGDAVAWVSAGESSAVLWMYDASTNHVASRVLDARPPFDEPTSAAVALSLKTLLRSSTVAPEPERFGATTESPPTSSLLRVEGSAGARVLPREVTELRGAFGLATYPRSLDEHLGIALLASVGTGAPVDAASFTGRFSDLALSPSLRTRLRMSTRFALEPALGGSLHFTSLAGTARPDAAPISVSRTDGSLDAALVFDVRFGAVTVGARAGASYLLRWQRYRVGDDAVLSLSPFMADVSLRVSVGLF